MGIGSCNRFTTHSREKLLTVKHRCVNCLPKVKGLAGPFCRKTKFFYGFDRSKNWGAKLPKDPLTTAIRSLAVLIAATVVVMFTVRVWPENPAAQAESTITFSNLKFAGLLTQQTEVGRDCMRGCHNAIVESFVQTTHGKSARFLNDSRAANCATCHGNSDKHAENSSPTRSAPGTTNPAKATATAANESCLQCHSRDTTHFDWKGSKHDRSDISCVSCHSVHHFKSPENMLVNFTVEDTCLRCHKEIRKALFQRSTHLFRTENRVMKVSCTSCHNPHGGEGRKMLVGRTTNDTCYECHAEKRGPLLFEHPPVQENCLTCHNSHGSNNISLLIRRSHQLCQQCHIHLLPRHSTVAGFDVFTFNRGCVNCHSQIHGSNHPAGKTFTR